jgi:aspartyl/asparaginyl beta-hydroxylase (cupin superfamily)
MKKGIIFWGIIIIFLLLPTIVQAVTPPPPSIVPFIVTQSAINASKAIQQNKQIINNDTTNVPETIKVQEVEYLLSRMPDKVIYDDKTYTISIINISNGITQINRYTLNLSDYFVIKEKYQHKTESGEKLYDAIKMGFVIIMAVIIIFFLALFVEELLRYRRRDEKWKT